MISFQRFFTASCLFALMLLLCSAQYALAQAPPVPDCPIDVVGSGRSGRVGEPGIWLQRGLGRARHCHSQHREQICGAPHARHGAVVVLISR